MAMAAAGADIVLLGADRIALSGAVSNKTGSLAAVLCAKHCLSSVFPRVVVLGETEKIASPADPDAHVVEENDPTQVSSAWLSSSSSDRVRAAAAALDSFDTCMKGTFTVRNVPFEWVPPELVDVYVTEKGVWTLQDIEHHSRALGQEEERLFGDL